MAPELSMGSLLLNLISGLVGAVVGAGISIYLYRRGQVETARQKLLGLVYQLGFQSWHNAGRNNWTLSIHEHYHQLWVLYAELHRFLMPWQRKKLDQAWYDYIRFPAYEEIPDTEFHKVFVKGTYASNREVTEASGKFVRFLTKIS